MALKNVTSNEEVLKRFKHIANKGRLAHAYLFIGPAYVGKSETAFDLAKSLLCEEKSNKEDSFCGQCSSCQKMEAQGHPDFFMVTSEFGEKIKIEEIRNIIDRVKIRPFLGEIKVFVIKNIENISLEGSNALLKTLEEPANHNVIILTTSVVEKVLPTIRSRCHIVYFSTESNQKLEEKLKNHYDVNEKDAHFLSYFAEGCLGKAGVLNDEQFVGKKNEIIEDFIFSYNAESYIKSVVSDKNKTRELLEVTLSWVRDCILVKSSVEDERLVHLDRIIQLKQFADKRSFEELSDLSKEIINASRLLAENLNLKIPLLIIKEKL